jgi:hypothetical protein
MSAAQWHTACGFSVCRVPCCHHVSYWAFEPVNAGCRASVSTAGTSNTVPGTGWQVCLMLKKAFLQAGARLPGWDSPESVFLNLFMRDLPCDLGGLRLPHSHTALWAGCLVLVELGKLRWAG